MLSWWAMLCWLCLGWVLDAFLVYIQKWLLVRIA